MTPYSLYNVERRGIQLRREISSKNRDFQAVLRLKQPDANSALIKWLNSSNKSDIKPTWRNLFLILHLVNLDRLAEEIETHLGGTYVKQLSKDTSNTEQGRGSEFDNLKATIHEIVSASFSIFTCNNIHVITFAQSEHTYSLL